MTINAIVPWFGGNRLLAHLVGEQLEGCSWVGIPYAGGMSELKHIRARTLLVNDKHRHVINLARVMADKRFGPMLYRELRRELFHPDTLLYAQHLCIPWEKSHPVNVALWPTVETYVAARSYFISQWMGRSGKAGTDGELRGGLAVRWNAGGGDSAVRFQIAVSAILEWRRLMRRCTFTCMDAQEFIDKVLDVAGNGVYCDAPWPDLGDGYKHKFTEEDHRWQAERLRRFTRARVVVRYGVHPLIEELYPESHWTWYAVDGRTQANKASAEVLIVNKIKE